MTAPPARARVRDALAVVARHTAHARPQPCPACEDSVLADRPDATVVRHGDTVAKAHAEDTDEAAHLVRLALAAHPLLAGVLLPPLPAACTTVHGRLVTAWPYGTPIDPRDPGAAPWEHVARLLARLHTVPLAALPSPPPPMRGPAKVARAVARMRAAGPHPASGAVRRAWCALPTRVGGGTQGTAAPAAPELLCHGDLHLGQLVRHPQGGPWVLIDVDDLGVGDPAWDLARPAAWFAAGLLRPDVWHRFLGAYRAAGGPAVPGEGDPWPRLDTPARALTVQTAALAVAKCVEEGRECDGAEQLMVDACFRIAALPPQDRDGD
jgi:Phosphotransferase enzyme family